MAAGKASVSLGDVNASRGSGEEEVRSHHPLGWPRAIRACSVCKEGEQARVGGNVLEGLQSQRRQRQKTDQEAMGSDGVLGGNPNSALSVISDRFLNLSKPQFLHQ